MVDLGLHCGIFERHVATCREAPVQQKCEQKSSKKSKHRVALDDYGLS